MKNPSLLDDVVDFFSASATGEGNAAAAASPSRVLWIDAFLIGYRPIVRVTEQYNYYTGINILTRHSFTYIKILGRAVDWVRWIVGYF